MVILQPKHRAYPPSPRAFSSMEPIRWLSAGGWNTRATVTMKPKFLLPGGPENEAEKDFAGGKGASDRGTATECERARTILRGGD